MWTKLDDRFWQHPTVQALSDSAYRMLVQGLVWCGANLTDGAIPGSFVAHLCPKKRSQTRDKALDELCKAGLFVATDDGYQIVNYLTYQPSRAVVLQRREKTRRRVEKHRATSTVTPLPDAYSEDGNAVSNNAPTRARPVSTTSPQTSTRNSRAETVRAQSTGAGAREDDEPNQVEKDDSLDLDELLRRPATPPPPATEPDHNLATERERQKTALRQLLNDQ